MAAPWLFNNHLASLAITHLHDVQALLHGRQLATIDVVDALQCDLFCSLLDVGSLDVLVLSLFHVLYN